MRASAMIDRSGAAIDQKYRSGAGNHAGCRSRSGRLLAAQLNASAIGCACRTGVMIGVMIGVMGFDP